MISKLFPTTVALLFFAFSSVSQILITEPSDLSTNISGTTYVVQKENTEFLIYADLRIVNNSGSPIIISFWATWCSPCKKELNTIHDAFEDWVEETGVKLIAVSVDDERTKSRVSPYVDSKGWEYDILLDPNGEFKRAMGVNNVPHTFVIDGTGKIVYSHNNYAPGDEEKLYEVILDLVK